VPELRTHDNLAPQTQNKKQAQEEVSWRKVNLALTIVWAIMIPISVVTGWINVVAFVSAISLYANVVSHLAAWRADVPTEEET
jgi:hypothetical protein